MTDHERMAALNAFMCDYDFTSVTIGDSPFTLERPRKAFDFAPPEPGNVYTFPVPDKQEGETMPKPKPVNVDRSVSTRVDNDQYEAIKQAMNVAGQRNKSDFIRAAIAEYCAKYGVEFPEGE